MRLESIQSVLAQIYTNTVLRNDFFANPQIVGRDLGLNDEETEQLSQLSCQQVDLFANSLKRKRLAEVRKLLPLTQKLLGRRFTTIFWQYAETNIPKGIKKHWQDAIAFCNFLEKTEIAEESLFANVIRYENAFLETLNPKRRFIFVRFDYEIQPLIESLQQGIENAIAINNPTIGIWLRRSRQKQWQHQTFIYFYCPKIPIILKSLVRRSLSYS